MQPIETLEDISKGLSALREIDPGLHPVIDFAGEVPLRRRSPDLKGLIQIVVAQQVSVASAGAIFARLEQRADPLDLPTLQRISDENLVEAGLSRPKIRTVRAIQTACECGLDLRDLADRPAEEAHATLCTIKGIGRWSADIFLLFCAGHPDIFPSGDLALRHAVHDALGLNEIPSIKDLDRISARWAPWRGVSARLFWAWYKANREGRETLPV